MSVCLSVRMLFPHSAKTNGPISKIQNANNSSLMQNRVLCLSFLESTSGFARKIENDLRKQVFGS